VLLKRIANTLRLDGSITSHSLQEFATCSNQVLLPLVGSPAQALRPEAIGNTNPYRKGTDVTLLHFM